MFQFIEANPVPIIDAAPHHLRMASAYRDAAGLVHVFVDFIDAAKPARQSWRAEIRHYTSQNLRDWKDHGLVVRVGNAGEPDSVGAASPHFVAHAGRGYVFYAGRMLGDPSDTTFQPGVGAGEPGWLRGEICVAVCDLDAQGAPNSPFEKHGVIAGLQERWGNSRFDDPSAFVHDGRWYLFHKVRHLRGDGSTQVAVALQICPVSGDSFSFQLEELPAIAMPGGGELCRLFRRQDNWHMFFTQWDRSDGGSLWRHAVSDDLRDWQIVNRHLFDTARPHPESAPDLCLINGPDGLPAEDQPLTALCTGRDERDGILKLFHYRVEETWRNRFP